MDKPKLTVVPKRQHRSYTKRQKLAAVLAAEVAGVVQAERQTGIPHTTIRQWIDRPEYADIRRKTREDLAEEYRVAAFLAVERVAELMPTMEARDAIFAAEKLPTLSQLLSGQATSRVETKELLNDFDDHETEAMEEWLREIAKERMAREGMTSAPDPT